MESDLNKSRTFCVDPRENPFYIIRDFTLRTDAEKCSDEKSFMNKYSCCQEIMENKNNLKSQLSQIIFHYKLGNKNIALFIIFFDKAKPLTLYQLKHILFEIAIGFKVGVHSTKYWTFVDVLSIPGCNAFNRLDDDSIIDITEPWYIDSRQIFFDTKLRQHMYTVFGDKTKFSQGYYHQCYDDRVGSTNINTSKNNNCNYNQRYKPLRVVIRYCW